MGYLLALDQGTTSSRAVIFDLEGRPLASAQHPLKPSFPRPGWVEQDPAEIWETTLRAAKDALEKAGIDPGKVAAIGITNQRETTIFWEKATGKPLGPAIVWQDRRTAPLTERLRQAGNEAWVRDKTGLVLDPYFSASKIAWRLDEDPELKRRAQNGEVAFGTVDAWLLENLTGQHLTDATNASRTLLLDLKSLAWDEQLLELFGVPRSLLPEVRPSIGAFGTTKPELFGRAIPITAVLGDQQAALFGQAAFTPGMAKNTYGTGAFVVMRIAEFTLAEGVLTTLAWWREGEVAYALEGSIFVAGALIQWLVEGLGIIEHPRAVEALARQVEDTGGVVLVPALTGLGAPHWDPYARGLIIGLTRGTTRAHIARAALEAIAYQTLDATQAMAAVEPIRELRVDGGASRNDLLMQIQADVLGVEVARPEYTETTAFGAAMAAAVGAGLLDLEAVSHRWKEARRFRPSTDPDRRQRGRAIWKEAVEKAKGWAKWQT